MESIISRLHAFYSRWHLLEESLGAKGGSVLDFDLAPRGPWREQPPFEDRLEALYALMDLQGDLEGATFLNPEAVAAKLKGAEVYLRLLLGERMPFEETFEAMMGLPPLYISKSDLQDDRAQVAETLNELGISMKLAAKAGGVGTSFHRGDMSTFEADLRGEAALWLERIKERVGVSVEGAPGDNNPGGDIQGFNLIVVKKDAYWSNWIDGNWEDGIRLQVNIHPRIRYTQTSHIGLAAHEIGGHALHVSTLIREAANNRLDDVLLNLTVHSMEAFHMEGLAQGVCGLIGGVGEVHPLARLREQLSRYHMGLLNNAHLDLEAGGHPGKVIDTLLAASPFLRRQSAIPSLQDRRSNPLLRSYQFVYGPARRLFEGAKALPDAQKFAFMGEMYRSIQTPTQIAARLAFFAEEARLKDGDKGSEDARPLPSTEALLKARHGEIAEGLRQLQRLVVEGKGQEATSQLSALLLRLEAHMVAEERHLFPAYGRGVPKPGRGAGRDVFEAEHRKLRKLGEQALKALKGLGSVGSGALSSEESLVILEAIHPFKQLLHHHEMREEALLGPALDDGVEEDARRVLYGELEEGGW